MKRISILLLLMMVGVTVVSLLIHEQARGQDHQGHASLNMRVDGSKNPEQIPDHVTQEAILRLLSASDEDVPIHRKNAYTRLSGFSDPEGVALLAAAYEFKRRVKELDEQAMDIKDEHWPTPSEGARGQLQQLQQQKEALIGDVVKELPKQLQIYGGSKWDEHIFAAKRKMKSFAPELPKRKIGATKSFICVQSYMRP